MATTHDECPHRVHEEVAHPVGGMYVNERACCVLLIGVCVDDDGHENKWVTKAAFDESDAQMFGQCWTASVVALGKNGVALMYEDMPNREPLTGDVDEKGITWGNGSRWKRFHMTRDQFYILTRPPPLFLTAFVAKKLFNVLSVPYYTLCTFWRSVIPVTGDKGRFDA